MNRVSALASALLVGIALLLSASCLSSAAEPSFNQSLEKVVDFHDHFKGPSLLDKGHWGLSSPSEFANEAGILGCPAWQTNGIIALDGNKHKSIEYEGSIDPSSPSANYLDIEVSRITVIAINMGKGGNAVARSDIVLNPVQNLRFYSEAEVEEKLK